MDPITSIPQSTIGSKRMQLQLAQSYLVEALRIWSKIDGPTHPNTVDTASQLTIISEELSLIEEIILFTHSDI